MFPSAIQLTNGTLHHCYQRHGNTEKGYQHFYNCLPRRCYRRDSSSPSWYYSDYVGQLQHIYTNYNKIDAPLTLPPRTFNVLHPFWPCLLALALSNAKPILGYKK